MKYEVPGVWSLTIETIVLDLNGTLAVGGKVPTGVKPRLARLKKDGLKVVFFSGNGRGDADGISTQLGIPWLHASDAAAKGALLAGLNPPTCAAIGNGLIDLALIKAAGLGIVTLQAEGVHVETLLQADIVIPNILDALDLFIYPERLIATLRP